MIARIPDRRDKIIHKFTKYPVTIQRNEKQ